MIKLFSIVLILLSLNSFASDHVIKYSSAKNLLTFNGNIISGNTDYIEIEKMLGNANRINYRNYFTDYFYDSIGIMFSVKKENAKVAEISFSFNDDENMKIVNYSNFDFYIDESKVTLDFTMKKLKFIIDFVDEKGPIHQIGVTFMK